MELTRRLADVLCGVELQPLAAVDQVQKVALTDTTEASAAAPVSKLQASESTLVKTEVTTEDAKMVSIGCCECTVE